MEYLSFIVDLNQGFRLTVERGSFFPEHSQLSMRLNFMLTASPN